MRKPVYHVMAAVLLALILLPGMAITGSAQADEVATTALLSVNVPKGGLPPAPAFLRLVRITLDPGATSVAHTHPGPEFGRIESGVIAVTVTGPASIKQRSAKEKDPFEAVKSGSTTNLDKGDQIYYPAGTTISFTNKGEDPAEVLAIVILPAAPGHPDLITYTEATPTDKDFAGVTSEILGDAIMTTIPTGDAVVALDRIQLKEGQSLPGTVNPVLFSVESGDCQFTITGGQVQISRMREPGAQTDVAQDENIKLRSGDSVFFANGTRTTSRGDNSAELDLLRVIVSPATADEKLSQEGRGSIRFKAPSTADTGDDEDNGDTASGFTKGGSVYVNSSDVNLRDSPSLNGGQVTVLLYGQEMTIDGDAVDADEVTWWPVHITADDTISGWVSGEFLQAEPVE